jgi:alpha-tubulin suppressor-like RCC1 family protein
MILLRSQKGTEGFYIGQNGIYVFGHNMYGQLGLGIPKVKNDHEQDIIDMTYTNVPQYVRLNEEIEKVYCGLDTTFLLTRKGQILCMGLNSDGQLGLGDTRNRDSPHLIPLRDNRKIKKLAVSTDVAMALDGNLNLN